MPSSPCVGDMKQKNKLKFHFTSIASCLSYPNVSRNTAYVSRADMVLLNACRAFVRMSVGGQHEIPDRSERDTLYVDEYDNSRPEVSSTLCSAKRCALSSFFSLSVKS